MPWPTLAIVVICGGAFSGSDCTGARLRGVDAARASRREVIARDVLLQRKTWGASAVLVGSDAATARLATHLLEHPELGLNPIGRIGNDKPDPDAGHEPRTSAAPPGRRTSSASPASPQWQSCRSRLICRRSGRPGCHFAG